MIEYDTPAGWYGTIGAFLEKPESGIREELRSFVSAFMLPIGAPQINAWKDSLNLLKSECSDLIDRHPESREWGFILEYELPRERGRRPDLVLLTGCSLNVIEFKGRTFAEQSDVDQVLAYGRDLAEYHGGSHNLKVNRILSLDGTTLEPQLANDVWIVGGKRLSRCLDHLADDPPCKAPDIEQWVRSDYSPLPTLVKAARRIFAEEPLPQIRRASSAGIPEALTALQNAASCAAKNGERHISFVTGVPGAGKTLVGLQFVHTTRLTNEDGERPAVFLSGNGPLVKVLQHALKSRVFVQAVHDFLVRYGGNAKRLPDEHIWVYDEAQRAWDSERVKGKRGHDLSEHEDFINLGMRMPKWSMLVGLIGQGQEIHLGEEGGLSLWNDAIRSSEGHWIIHCPADIAHVFPDQNVVIEPALNLSTSLRSHLAGDLHDWVSLLLQGKLFEAGERSDAIKGSAFNLYVTRDLELAKHYVRNRYDENEGARYGLLASSKSRNLANFGMDASFQATRRFREGPWYNDAPESLASCCQLLAVATEFQCQGLELDFPIVGWDTDLFWDGNIWAIKRGRSSAIDPLRLRINSYRVLLTRGRDGMIIFVPPIGELDLTFAALRRAGCEELNLLVPLLGGQ